MGRPADTEVARSMRALAEDLATALDGTPDREARVALLTQALESALADLGEGLRRERLGANQLIAALLERAGGTVRLPRKALIRDRGEVLTTETDKLADEFVLTLTRPKV